MQTFIMACRLDGSPFTTVISAEFENRDAAVSAFGAWIYMEYNARIEPPEDCACGNCLSIRRWSESYKLEEIGVAVVESPQEFIDRQAESAMEADVFARRN
jgi:hypothetical protein